MNSIPRVSRLFVAMAFVLGPVSGASAQTMGSTLASFNILARPAVTLTGFAAAPMVVERVGTSPGITLTTTDARASTYHANDLTAVNGQAEAQVLWDSLTNVAAVTVEVLAAATLPPTLPPAGAYLDGVTKITAAANITDTGSVTITGTPNSIIIIQAATFLSFTNMDVVLAGGILPSNVYWQITTAVTIINNDATTRSVPGTFINNTAAQNIAVTSSGAGGLNTGRLVSRQGEVTVTQSGAGSMLFVFPVAGPGVFSPGCSDGLFYPSPATGPVGTFSYCMQAAGTVKIRVYNAIGDLAVRVDDSRPSGQHTSTIDTGRLAPGVYFYVLERDYNNGDKARSKVKKFVVKH